MKSQTDGSRIRTVSVFYVPSGTEGRPCVEAGLRKLRIYELLLAPCDGAAMLCCAVLFIIIYR